MNSYWLRLRTVEQPSALAMSDGERPMPGSFARVSGSEPLRQAAAAQLSESQSVCGKGRPVSSSPRKARIQHDRAPGLGDIRLEADQVGRPLPFAPQPMRFEPHP